LCGKCNSWREYPRVGRNTPLGTKDFYFESIQPHDKSIKILLSVHRNGFINIKTKASLKDILKSYSFNKVFLNCTCRITFNNIQDLLSQPSTKYTVYHKAHKCRGDYCTLSKNVSSKTAVINQFVSQDTVIDKCEILTHPSLISKYNKIIEKMTLYSVRMRSTLENAEIHKQERYISSVTN
jgi:hypothetical protein